MRKSIIAAIAAISAVGLHPAHATDWWIIDAGKGRCLNAATLARQHHAPEFASPGAMQTALRNDGTFKDIKITRDDSNNVSTVFITRSKGGVMSYAATQVACEDALRRLVDGGFVATKRELE